MGRSKPVDVKVTTVTLSSGGKPVKLGSDTTEHMLPAKRMEHATTKLQDAMSALKLAAEELQIVDSTMIGSDEHRRLIVASSAENPQSAADDIRSHQAQAVEISEFAAAVAKTARAVKSKGAFLAQALGSVYQDEIQAGDEGR
jgi:hypothetical protein